MERSDSVGEPNKDSDGVKHRAVGTQDVIWIRDVCVVVPGIGITNLLHDIRERKKGESANSPWSYYHMGSATIPRSRLDRLEQPTCQRL